MSNVRYTNRDGVVGFEQKHSTVVFGTKLRFVGKSAPHTFQNPFIVDVCVVSHHVSPSIVIIHLAVYEVMSGFDDCNEASVVVNIAQLITYNPVGYKNTCCVKTITVNFGTMTSQVYCVSPPSSRSSRCSPTPLVCRTSTDG